MLETKKKARPVGDATGQAVGIGFAIHVPENDCTTVYLRKRHLFTEVYA